MNLLKPAVCTLLMLSCQALQAAAKTDVVVLNNGDRITGEIKKLEAGLLEFKTDTMGTVQIEWRFVAEVNSEHNHVVETADGSRWLGKLQSTGQGGAISVSTMRGPVSVPPADAVAVWPVATTFLDKVDLSLAVGMDYSKATDITNINIATDFLHQSDRRLTEASLRTDITRQDDGTEQNRNEIRTSHQYLLERGRFRSYFAGTDSNDALGLDLRIYGGAGFGKYFRKTNRQWLTLSSGLLASEENLSSGSNVSSLELLGNVRYRYFSYATPERVFDTTFSVFPSLTEGGRWRTDLRSTFRLELVKDLFWSMEVYHTHDSEPPSEDAEKSDYGITSSLGYSF